MNIVNLNEATTPGWTWLQPYFSEHDWYHYASHLNLKFKSLPKHETINRMLTTLAASQKARKKSSIIVSHGHTLGMMAGYASSKICPDTPHLAYTLSFVDLPEGKKRKFAIKALEGNTKKVLVYTTMQQKQFSKHFEMPIEKVDMLHWIDQAPHIDLSQAPIETGRYCCALGSQGRDYKILFEAMKQLPNIKLVVVASPASLNGLDIPANVKIYTNIPLKDAHNILAHSEFSVLPLRDAKTATGHMTIVASMFLKKTVLASEYEAAFDYIQDGHTGLFFNPKDVNDLKLKIQSLWDDPVKTVAMNDAAYAFADEYCTEKNAVKYLDNFIKEFG